MSDSSIALKRRPGRPRLPVEKRMEFLSIQIPHELRSRLDTVSTRCDKSISELGREALNILMFVYEKEESDGRYV